MRTRRGKGRAKRAGRDVHWLTWPSGQGTTGFDGECMLRRVGIPVLDRQLAKKVGDNYGMAVPASQAEWAEYILCRAGVALSSPLLNPNHGTMETAPQPPSWGAPSKPAGINGWFVALLGWMFRGDVTKGAVTASTKRRPSKTQRTQR